MMSKTVTIIGLGQMGSALALVAANAGSTVKAVGTPQDREVVESLLRSGIHPNIKERFPDSVSFHFCEEWEELAKESDFVIGAISSYGVDWFLEEILSRIDPCKPVLSAAKGLFGEEDGSMISYPEYWERALAEKGVKRDIYALGGPGTADEIRRGEHTHVVVCGRDASVLGMMKEALETSYFHISTTHDLHGLECAVALKNAYALGVAMAIGYANRLGENESHANMQANVFYQASREMMLYLKAENASDESVFIGMGDLYVTVTGARTRKLGILLGEGKTYEEASKILSGMTLESIVIVRRLALALKKKAGAGLVRIEDFPLLNFVSEVLESGKMTDFPWKKFTFSV